MMVTNKLTKMNRSGEHIRNPFKPSLTAKAVTDQINLMIDEAKTNLYNDLMYAIECRAHSLNIDGQKALRYRFSDDPVGEAITRGAELRDLLEDLKAFDPRMPKG